MLDDYNLPRDTMVQSSLRCPISRVQCVRKHFIKFTKNLYWSVYT